MPGKRVARPPRLYPPGIDDLVMIALRGATDDEICAHLQVPLWRLRDWEKQYPHFRTMLDNGRTVSDINVLRANYLRCVGYEYEEQALDRFGAVVTLKKHLPGDVKAQMNWMSQRQKEYWQAQKAAEADGSANVARMEIVSRIYHHITKDMPAEPVAVAVEAK